MYVGVGEYSAENLDITTRLNFPLVPTLSFAIAICSLVTHYFDIIGRLFRPSESIEGEIDCSG